jgi:3-deoxy-D-manno-octulosonic acid kinase
MAVEALPAGFVQFTVARARVVCAAELEHAVRTALEDDGTLYTFASRQTGARALAGRGVAYAVALPGEMDRVVVRHNRHGGLLAPLTGDVFRWPTRAPLELRVSERLVAAGVATPPIAGYALYRAAPGFWRADVMTREIPDSADLSTILMAPGDDRGAAFAAAAALVASLAAAGARHHDLNVKNVLLHSAPGGIEALALDVDRVTFDGDRQAVLEANLARLLRSARKWRELRGARVSESELDELAAHARALSATRAPAPARTP